MMILGASVLATACDDGAGASTTNGTSGLTADVNGGGAPGSTGTGTTGTGTTSGGNTTSVTTTSGNSGNTTSVTTNGNTSGGSTNTGTGTGTTNGDSTGSMTGSSTATTTGTGGDGGVPDSGTTGTTGGSCCSDGDCICRDEPPSALTSDDGPYSTDSYDMRSAGCIYYPTDAEPPFSAVAISDGFVGTGGCGRAQTGLWGDFLASWGIATMIIHTGGSDQPRTRGTKLGQGIEAFKAENENSSSPLFGKLAGRYGTGGFSMGGGGTTYAASDDPSLKSSLALMSWTPTGSGVTVPTMFTLGSSDTLAGNMGMSAYRQMPDTTPKIAVTVRSGHAGQPTSGSGMQGAWGLAFMKRYLDGDERWTEVLLSGDYDEMSAIE